MHLLGRLRMPLRDGAAHLPAHGVDRLCPLRVAPALVIVTAEHRGREARGEGGLCCRDDQQPPQKPANSGFRLSRLH